MKPSLLLMVFCGGGVGALSRYVIAQLVVASRFAAAPWLPICMINVVGSVLIGLAFSLLVLHHGGSAALRCFFIIGFLGGFTTFSSFSLDVMMSLSYGNLSGALLNVLLTVGLSLLGCYAGMLLGRCWVA